MDQLDKVLSAASIDLTAFRKTRQGLAALKSALARVRESASEEIESLQGEGLTEHERIAINDAIESLIDQEVMK